MYGDLMILRPFRILTIVKVIIPPFFILHIFFVFKKTQLFVIHLKETQLFSVYISFFLFIFFSFEKTQLLFTQIIFFICLVVCPDVRLVICPVIRPVICSVIRPLPSHPPGYSSGYLMFPNLNT